MSHRIRAASAAYVTSIALLLNACAEKSRTPQAPMIKVPEIEAASRAEVETTYRVSADLPQSIVAIARGDTIDPVGSSDIDPIGMWSRTGTAIADGYRVVLNRADQGRIASVGRKGQGPGEFMYLNSICQSRGDTIVAGDAGHRTSVLTESGKMVRQFVLPSGTLLRQAGCLQDGSILAMSFSSRTDFGLNRHDLNGALVNSLGKFEFDYGLGGTELLVEPAIEAEGESVFYGNPWYPEVREFSSTGTLLRVMKFADRQTDTYDLGASSGPFAAPAAGNTSSPAKPRLTHWPFFHSIRVSSDGVVWIRDYPKKDNSNDRWTGFSKDGKPVGALVVDRSTEEGESIEVIDFRPGEVLLRYNLKSGQVFYVTTALDSLRKPVGDSRRLRNQ